MLNWIHNLANSINDFTKGHLPSIGGTTVTWIAVITANQNQIEWWFKIVSYLLAILVSAATLWHLLRKK